MSRTINPYPYSDDNKRYRTYSCYLRRRFGKKIYRVALDIGAGCPNRDGSRGIGGCIFCSASSSCSGRFTGISPESLKAQFEEGRRLIGSKCPDGPYIAYFQAGTNTYGDSAALKNAFETALGFDNVIGLAIATRADCIDKEKADMLAALSEKTYLTVELGLQSVHDKTAELCNRCHTYKEFLKAYRLLRERGINVGVHIINGLPHETHGMMLETAKRLAELDLHCMKIHLLYVEEGTPLASLYRSGGFEMITQEQYTQTVCDQLEVLPPDLILARMTGDADRSRLIAPQWSLKKLCVMNEIDKEMARRNTMQGAKYAAPK